MSHYGSLPDIVAGPVTLLLGLFGLWVGLDFAGNVRAMLATERSDIGTLPAAGLVEVTGRVHEVPDLLTAPVSGADCIAYTVRVEEYRRDDDITKEWVTVSDVDRATPFVLTDDTGTVTVEPEPDGDLSYPETAREEVEAGEAVSLSTPVGGTGDDDYERRVVERRLPADGELYVLGTATEDGDRITDEGDSFVVSADSERRTTLRQSAYAAVAFLVGLGLVAGGGWLTAAALGVA